MLERWTCVMVSICWLGLGLGACAPKSDGAPASSPASTSARSELESAFAAAAREYQVPESVLKAVAYVETRVNPRITGSPAGGQGMMQLVERPDWDMLGRASELTGLERGRLKLDAEANIRGAAAVLRELADASFRAYADLNPHNPADFFHAVSLYAGLDSAPLAQDYARQVYETMERGFRVERPNGAVVLEPTATDWQRHLAWVERQDALGDYPNIASYVQSPNYSSGRTSYTYVVVHTMQGSYAGTLSWFRNSNSNVSAHYIVRSSDGQIAQMVQHKDSAWHASCYNSKSIGIEHEGYVSDPGKWYTQEMYAASAKLTRWIADRHGIPKTRSRIIGHVEVAPECNKGRHYDPGSGWNWTRYMSLVAGTAPTASTGVLTGVIYSGTTTSSRISGATVTTAGRTSTTGTDGTYSFSLPAGTYTVNVSKSGYKSGSITRTVTAGATTWGSLGLTPATATGKLAGVIFENGSSSNPVGGATVSVSGKTVTTASDGEYEFTLAPGSYTVRVSKAGYDTAQVTRTVSAGTTVWGSVELKPTGGASGADTTPPDLTVTSHQPQETVEVAYIDLQGTVTDASGAVPRLTVRLNGGAPVDVAVSQGAFEASVKLLPGLNAVVLTAQDSAGNQSQKTLSLTLDTGISGVVYDAESPETPLSGATVSVRDPTARTELASGTTDASGNFQLSLREVPQDVVLLVKRDGYVTNAQTVSVPDDARVWVEAPLARGTNPTPDEMSVSFIEPTDGQTVAGETLEVYVSVEGLPLPAVTLNGVSAERVGEEGFSAVVPLTVGENTLEAVATGLEGERLSARIEVFRDDTYRPEASRPIEAKGGCSSTGVAGLLALVALVPLATRPRRRR